MIMRLIEEDSDDDNHPSSEKVIDNKIDGRIDVQYGSKSGRYNIPPRKYQRY